MPKELFPNDVSLGWGNNQRNPARNIAEFKLKYKTILMLSEDDLDRMIKTLQRIKRSLAVSVGDVVTGIKLKHLPDGIHILATDGDVKGKTFVKSGDRWDVPLINEQIYEGYTSSDLYPVHFVVTEIPETDRSGPTKREIVELHARGRLPDGDLDEITNLAVKNGWPLKTICQEIARRVDKLS